MKRTVLLSSFAAAALLAACDRPAQQPDKPPVAFNPAPPAPPAVMPPTYVGLWAASAQECATRMWTFNERNLSAAGAINCDFKDVTANDAGWIAEGTCTGNGPPERAALVLNTTRVGENRTLAVSGGPFAKPQVLVACPAATGAPTSINPGAPSDRLDEAAAIDKRIYAGLTAKGSGLKTYTVTLEQAVSQVWSDNGEIAKIAEPLVGQAGIRPDDRVYYFRAGEADPFLIRDAGGVYAFDAGKLIAVFSREGVQLQAPVDADRIGLERRLMDRARALKAAAPKG